MSVQAERLLQEYLAEAATTNGLLEELSECTSTQALLHEDGAVQAAVLMVGLQRLLLSGGPNLYSQERGLLTRLLGWVVERPLPLTPDQVLCVLEALLTQPKEVGEGAFLGIGYFGIDLLWNLLSWCHDHGLPPAARPALEALLAQAQTRDDTETRRLALRLAELLSGELPDPLVPMKPWGKEAADWVGSLEEPARTHWTELLHHARTAFLSEPSPRWLEVARERVNRVGSEGFERGVRPWFHLGAGDRTKPLADRNSVALRGLAWCAGAAGCRGLAGDLAELVEAGYAKPKKCAIRSGKLGDAGLVALGLLGGSEAVAQISGLRRRVRHPAAVAAMDRALRAAVPGAADLQDLEEIALPDYGLDLTGQLRQEMGGYTAVVRFPRGRRAEWQWEDAHGKVQKSIPAAVRRECAAALEDLKVTVRDIEDVLPAQAARLERQFLAPRRWPLPVWRERYLDHPLVVQVARRLIWRFEEGDRVTSGIWSGDRLVNVDGKPLDLRDTAQVTLWHPQGETVEGVLAWRLRVEEHGPAQPFKQAHREVYLLTDAERATATYSNRFAAHLLRHYQFNALCAGRGWTYKLPRFHDPGANARLVLPGGWGRAELWVEPAGQEMSDTGVASLVSTDQVRFYAPEGNLLPLESVPPRLFSEVMRDVDLFVGVCSVGNDPEWMEGRDDNRTRYWRDYAFGELSAAAATRRDLLSRLLPRLRIGERCSLQGRFLRVRGELRTYRIHLGSGNILMEPNDQYLCIVAARQEEDRSGVFLPFEGDGMLSLILSKAFLLAEDHRIEDASITRQIRAG